MNLPASPSTCPEEHPFAPYVRALGRGRRGARSLERDEARTALGMILDGEVDPLQTGAFLMLLRVKEETADEIAGFVQAARERAQLPELPIGVDLDWPTYAGKRQQPPWYLLSALLLAAHGHRVLMHGCEPHARNRLFAAQALPALGIAPARNWHAVREALQARHFAYVPLALFSPGLQALLNLRHLLGLRSPVNTFVRHMNPLGAPATLQSLQHPAYAVLHAGASRLLGQPRALVLRGEGGECELRPNADSRCILLEGNTEREAGFARQVHERGDASVVPDAAALPALWSGHREDAYGEAAVIGTAAAALLALGRAQDPDAAQALARDYWRRRGPWPGDAP